MIVYQSEHRKRQSARTVSRPEAHTEPVQPGTIHILCWVCDIRDTVEYCCQAHWPSMVHSYHDRTFFLILERPPCHETQALYHQVTWGMICCLTSLVKSSAGLIAARFFLGLVEAGFLPGIIFWSGFHSCRNSYSGLTSAGVSGVMVPAPLTGPPIRRLVLLRICKRLY